MRARPPYRHATPKLLRLAALLHAPLDRPVVPLSTKPARSEFFEALTEIEADEQSDSSTNPENQ